MVSPKATSANVIFSEVNTPEIDSITEIKQEQECVLTDLSEDVFAVFQTGFDTKCETEMLGSCDQDDFNQVMLALKQGPCMNLSPK